MHTVRTERLDLVPATAELVRAEIEDPAQFFALLGVAQAEDWPSENLAHALPIFLEALSQNPESAGWWPWYWIDRSQRALVGGGGFKGRPTADGDVEIGYETRPAYRRQGYAREAVSGLVAWAMAQPGVGRVVAETRADNAPSIALLTKLGLEEAGVGSERDLLRFEVAPHAG